MCVICDRHSTAVKLTFPHDAPNPWLRCRGPVIPICAPAIILPRSASPAGVRIARFNPLPARDFLRRTLDMRDVGTRDSLGTPADYFSCHSQYATGMSHTDTDLSPTLGCKATRDSGEFRTRHIIDARVGPTPTNGNSSRILNGAGVLSSCRDVAPVCSVRGVLERVW